MSDVSALLDVFSASDIAGAAGADVRDIRVLIASGRVPTIDGQFVAAGAAVELVRSIRAGAPMLAAPPALFQPSAAERREAGVPLVGSVVAHAVMIGGFALMLGVGAATHEPAPRIDKSNLVFLISPGPGGGGGGGGLQQRTPAARAEIRGISARRSPVRTERVVEPKAPEPEKPLPAAVPEPAPRVEEPRPAPPQPEPAPPVVAPVATVASDTRDRAGVPTESAPEADSRGTGSGGGAGTGAGTGLGEGRGSGIGQGSGGGTGGGPYRPGSGITAPSLLREVKPDYTEEARRRGVNGDVELQIVVRSDGSVGEVRLLRGLGAGLDQRAIDAVRQWRFSPARRLGTPVDVLVEVAVEFKLR